MSKQREREIQRLPVVQFCKELHGKKSPYYLSFSSEDFEKADVLSTLIHQGFSDSKPMGLWLSRDCDWILYLCAEYVVNKNWDAYEKLEAYTTVQEIQLREDRLLYLNTKKAALEFTKSYGVFVPSRRNRYEYPYMIGWDFFANKYHGIVLSNPFRDWWNDVLWLSEWSASGACIFDRRAIQRMEKLWEL